MYKGQEYLIEGLNLYPDKIKGMLILKQALSERNLWKDDDIGHGPSSSIDAIVDDLIREYSVED